VATIPAQMTYPQFLSFYNLQHGAASALAWLKSGHAPVGTPIPVGLRPQFAGQGSLRLGTPGVDWSSVQRPPTAEQVAANPIQYHATLTPGVEGTPPGTLPQVQNPYAVQIALQLGQLANLPTLTDMQRQAVANQTAASLQERGLVDWSPAAARTYLDTSTAAPQVGYDFTTPQTTTLPGTNIPAGHVYGLVQGADGRAYLQAYTGVAHGSASRGVFSGSQVEAQQGQARQALDFQRANAYESSRQQQAALTGQQLGQVGSISKSIADYMSKGAADVANTIAGWQATPSVPGTPPSWTAPAQPTQPTNPSPLTQMTGGQRTVTGSLSKVARPIKTLTGQVSAAVPGLGKNVWQQATSGGLTTRKLGG
jgi:hypothetical protein